MTNVRMTIDLSRARVDRDHAIVGVTACVGDRCAPVAITPDGCRPAAPDDAGVPCEAPVIGHDQAWAVAIMLTGDVAMEPRGSADVSDRGRRVSYVLGRSRRIMLA